MCHVFRIQIGFKFLYLLSNRLISNSKLIRLFVIIVQETVVHFLL